MFLHHCFKCYFIHYNEFHPSKCSRPGWIGLGTNRSSGKGDGMRWQGTERDELSSPFPPKPLFPTTHQFINLLTQPLLLFNHNSHVFLDCRCHHNVQHICLGGHFTDHLVVGEDAVAVEQAVMLHALPAQGQLRGTHGGNDIRVLTLCATNQKLPQGKAKANPSSNNIHTSGCKTREIRIPSCAHQECLWLFPSGLYGYELRSWGRCPLL